MTGRPRVLVVLGNLALNGQERANIEVYRALRAEGVDALFATHAGWGGRHVQPYLDRLGLRWAPVPYARHFTKRLPPGEAARNVGRVLAASRAFWRVARAYRPTHVHLANPHYALCVLPALWALRVPVVYRLGDAPVLHHAFYRQLWRRGIVPLVDRFVCNSDYVAQTARASGVPDGKVRVVYSAPPERPPAEVSDLPADFTAVGGTGGRTVLYVGQVAEHKGVHLLLDAVLALAARWPDLRVLVAGQPSSRGYSARLAARMLENGLQDRVRFLGYVEDVQRLMAIADIHVCPSVWEEPLANVVLEAKRAGVPSVVFPSGGLPETIVEQGQDGYVCRDRTAEALAEGVEHYLGMDETERAAAGQAARASLVHLGTTEEPFRRAWLSVLTEVQERP